MEKQELEIILTQVCKNLTHKIQSSTPKSASDFEDLVRKELDKSLINSTIDVDFSPHPQAFPDIELGEYGVEVKYTTSDSWRSVANSVLETNRINSVKHVYLVFGKTGGEPEVKWGRYEDSVMHVRTSHVPRFEVEIGAQEPLFKKMGIPYDQFRQSEMHEKMQYIREYARGRLKRGERLWWLEDRPDQDHSLPIQARLYTKLSMEEKTRLRAECYLLFPQILKSGRTRDKYDDAVLYLLTYHGVLCHQARDLFSAGSVANPNNDKSGGLYVERALRLIEPNLIEAALTMDDVLFVEYWGQNVDPENRITEWLKKADEIATDWVPSQSLFLN
ncbi:hypothetical protein [Alteromonas lipotrueae]|uniref:hypothetical protein n=1 Tax=Alteromonas lipotrueae TaxID=2803814 RepID=UPI001C45A638|nr:hypothetical protein [Alteromonas lipotrueae]